MKKLYALNDWGIHISHAEVEAGLITAEQIQKADGMLINPIAGDIYFDESGNYEIPQAPFWFIPVSQPGLYESPYESIEDIEAELDGLLPDALLARGLICERLCRANVVDEQEDENG